MAGGYPDMPSRRMAYDDDGTVIWWSGVATGDSIDWGTVNLTGISHPTTTMVTDLNDEATTAFASWGNSASSTGTRFFAFLFPEPRDIYGAHLFMNGGSDSATWGEWQGSTDSTNGITGSFTTISIAGTTGGDLRDYGWHPLSVGLSSELAWRSYVQAFDTSLTAVRCFRWGVRVGGALTGNNHSLQSFHLYGTVNASFTGDRVLFVDNDTGLEFTAPLDWGDVPRGVTLDREIKIRNNSSTATANSIDLSFEALTGTLNTLYTIKEAGGSFATTLNITSIAPSSDSAVLTVRLNVPDSQIPGQNAASRIRAAVGSWS